MNQKITKNQHYVPKLLIKHFCQDRENTKINVFDTGRAIFLNNQHINNVFSENYCYDRDNQIEDFLEKQIETPASVVIDKIVAGEFDVVDKDETKLKLIRFIWSLLSRTPEAEKRTFEFINPTFEPIVRELLRRNGFNPEEASNGEFKPEKKPRTMLSNLVLDGILDSTLLKDLNFYFIENITKQEFYISDHPVFFYNWLYRNLQDPRITGITARGVQIFLPLSSKIMLCLYDDKVYKYGKKKSSVTEVSEESDIDILNSFQIINSNSIICFSSTSNETNLKKLYEKNKNIKLFELKTELFELETSEEEIRQQILTDRKQHKLQKMPSFIKIKKEAKSYAKEFSEREPGLYDRHQKEKEELLK